MQIAISGYETIKLYDARFTISERIGERLIESSERWQKEQGMKGGGGGVGGGGAYQNWTSANKDRVGVQILVSLW